MNSQLFWGGAFAWRPHILSLERCHGEATDVWPILHIAAQYQRAFRPLSHV